MSTGSRQPIPPRVFISYAQHESAHSARVLELARALAEDGLEVELDQFHRQEIIDWSAWCSERLDPANTDFVLMVCSAEYRRRIEGKVELDVGRGVFWEGTLIRGYLYREKANDRFVPLLLDDEPESSLLPAVANWNWFRLRGFGLKTGDPNYENLVRLLTRQPDTPRPKSAPLKRLSPRISASPIAVENSQDTLVQPETPDAQKVYPKQGNRSPAKNFVLIEDAKGFNHAILEALKSRADGLRLGEFPFEGVTHTDRDAYEKEWRHFMASDSPVLFTIFPPNVKWTQSEIDSTICELSEAKKQVVFFESGHQFQSRQEKILNDERAKEDERTKGPAHILSTNYSHAMLQILEVASQLSKKQDRRDLVIARLFPEAGLSRAADARRLVLDQVISSLICESASSGPGVPMKSQQPSNEIALGVLKVADIFRVSAARGDVAIINASTSDWKGETVRIKADAMQEVAEYAERRKALLVLFCGNDDMAEECYHALPSYFSPGGCSLLTGFDGFPESELTRLISNGISAVTAQIALDAMCEEAASLVQRNKRYRSEFSAKVLIPPGFPE